MYITTSKTKSLYLRKPTGRFTVNKDSVQAQGLVGWWPGSIHDFNSGFIYDAAGGGFHGTISSTVKLYNDPLHGGVLNFDNTGASPSQNVTISNFLNAKFGAWSGDIAVYQWIYPTTVSGYVCLFDTTNRHLSHFIGNTYYGIGTSNSGYTAITPYTTNQWQLSGLIRQGGTLKGLAYRNGLYNGDLGTVAGTLFTETWNWGDNPSGGGTRYTGLRGETRVYKIVPSVGAASSYISSTAWKMYDPKSRWDLYHQLDKVTFFLPKTTSVEYEPVGALRFNGLSDSNNKYGTGQLTLQGVATIVSAYFVSGNGGILSLSNYVMRLWEPKDATVLDIWLKSDNVNLSGVSVTSAIDASGNGYDFTPPGTAPEQLTNQLNGYPVINHNFVGARPISTAVTRSYTNFTVFLVTKPFSPGATGRLLDANYASGWWMGISGTGTTDQLTAGVKFGSSPYGRGVTLSGAWTNWNICGLIRTTATTTDAFWLNGNWSGRNSGTTSDNLATSAERIGVSDVATGGSGFGGRQHWSELLIYSSSLSDSDREKAEGYLAWKYGLDSTLPASHPYKYEAPFAVRDVEVTTGNFIGYPEGSLRVIGLGIANNVTYNYLSLGTIQILGTSATTNAYEIEATGKLTFNGLVTSQATYLYGTMLGMLAFSGTSGNTNVYEHTTTGKLTLSATQSVVVSVDYLAYGALAFSGLADGTSNTFVHDPVGSLTVNGLTVSFLTMIHETLGLLVLNGTSNTTNVFVFEPIGSMVFTGIALTEVSFIANTTGVLLLSGVATVNAAGVFETVGQFSFNSGDTEIVFGFNVEPEGKLTVNGEADADFDAQVVEGVGGLTLNGEADTQAGGIFVSTGNLTFKGLASASTAFELYGLKATQFTLEVLYVGDSTGEYEAVGSLAFMGEAPHFMFVQPELKIDGLAEYAAEYIANDNAGLLFLSGSTNVQINYSYTASGALVLSSDEIVVTNPELRFDGVASYEVAYIYDAQGLLSILGVSQPEAYYFYESSGLLTLSGLASLFAQTVTEQEFTWKVLQTQTLTKEFTWSVGSRPLSFYRVTGKCRPALCPPLKPSDCNSNITFVVNILARNVSEVCRKLKQRNFNFPIATIEQFSNPASIPTPSDLYSCNQLIDVTPSFSNLECVDLLVDINVTEHMVMGAVFIKAFAYTGHGGFAVKGIMPFTAFRIIEPEGSLTFGGIADASIDSFIWNTSGGFILSDTVELAFTSWEYFGSGAIVVNGLSTTGLILDGWTSEPEGSIIVLDNSNPITTVSYLSSGLLTTGLSTGLDFSLEFTQNGSGRKSLSGAADVYLEHYEYEPIGSLNFTMLFRFISSAYTIIPTGALKLKGAVPYLASGKLTLGGLATVVYGQQSVNGGRIRFSGEALVEIPVAEGIGQLTFGGIAEVYCSDLGIVNLGTIGVTDLVASQNVVFAFVPAPFALPVTTRVLTPCCSDSQPIAFVLEQNLSSLNYFSKFLQRNALSFSKTLVLSYNSRSKLWSDTIVLTGFAPEYPGTERWNITCLWDCVTDSLSTPAWRLNVTFNQLSLISGKHRVSKMLFYFDNSQVCKKSKTVEFPFTFNSKIVTTKPSTIRPVVFEDGIGLFKNSKFLSSPTISFKISETPTDSNRGAVDVAPQIQASSDRGVNLVEAIASRDAGSEISVLVNPDGTFVTTVTPPALPPSS